MAYSGAERARGGLQRFRADPDRGQVDPLVGGVFAVATGAEHRARDPGLDEQTAWSKHLDGTDIQYLVLEFEEKMTSFEQMSMQLETFAESLLFAVAA